MNKKKTSVQMFDLRQIVHPWMLTDQEVQMEMAMRLLLNHAETGHPFRHLTGNGAVVEPDPMLDYYISRQSEESQQRIRDHWMALVKPNARPAIPVNRAYYGHDPFAEHEKETSHEPDTASR